MSKRTKKILTGMALVIITSLTSMLLGMDLYDFCRSYMCNMVAELWQGWMLLGVLSRIAIVIAGAVGAFICFVADA